MNLNWLDRLSGNPTTLPLRNLVLNLVALFSLVAQVVFFFADTVFSFSWLRFVLNLGMMPLFAYLYWAVRFGGGYQWGRLLATIVGLLFVTSNFFGNGGSGGSNWVVTMAVLGIFALIHEAKAALGYGALTVGLLLACLGVEAMHPEWVNHYQTPGEQVLDLLLSFAFCGGMLFLLILLVMHYYGESNERTRRALAVSAQTEKLAALGEAMASLNHEISNPLGIMELALTSAQRWWSQDFPRFPRIFERIPQGQAKAFWTFLEEGCAAPPVFDLGLRNTRRRDFAEHLSALGVSDTLADPMSDYYGGPWNPAWDAWIGGAAGEALLNGALRFVDMADSYRSVAAAHGQLMALVDSLSDYSRLDANTGPSAVNLAESLDLVVALFVGHRSKTVEVIRNFETVPPISGHPDELIQVWTNLVKNALSAMDDKGTLKISLFRSGSHAVVTVDDTGPGVDSELQHQIFEPFFTTKGAGKGTGLGLAIVRRIVTEHGGTVELGQSLAGARFVVKLPLDPHIVLANPSTSSHRPNLRTVSG